MNYVKQFIGKVCTIIVGPINRDFKDEAHLSGKPQIYPMNMLDHFMGRVIYADPQSIVIRHPIIGTETWFNLNQVVCIAEEQELDPNNPEHAKAIESYKQSIEEKQHIQQPQQQVSNNTQLNVKRIACPSCKRGSKVPSGLEENSLVQCPFCQFEFRYKSEETHSNFVNIDSLQDTANKSKN
jgi:RNase P subunit RPR2